MPSNTTFATAVTISAFPYSITQSDINVAGTNFTVYYRFIAPPGARVIGAFGFSDNIGIGYQPTVQAYNGPASSPTNILSIAGRNIPIQFPVVAGNEYFLEFSKNINTAGPEHININVQVHNDLAISNGNIVVMDDTAGFPIAVMSNSADNTVIAFFTNMPAGEAGDITKHGIMLMENNSTFKVDLYAKSFTLITSISITGTPKIRACRGVSKFYVGTDTNPPTARSITESGGIGTVFTLAGSTLQSLAADNAESILYYSARGFGVPVKRWDLVNNVALSDLAASVATYENFDILVIADGTILVLYYSSSTKDVQVKRYSTGGAVLNTYTLGVQSGTTEPRMAYGLDDPTSFWVFSHNNVASSGRTIARNVKVSDGSIITTRSWQEYEGGSYNSSVQTATPVSRFGNSFSCPFFVMAGDLSGVYFVNSSLTHDNYYSSANKIPNPTIRTALVGE